MKVVHLIAIFFLLIIFAAIMQVSGLIKTYNPYICGEDIEMEKLSMTNGHCGISPPESNIDLKILCYIDGNEINCNDFPGDEHFCNEGICEMNGVQESG